MLDLDAELLSDEDGAFAVGVGEQDQELLAAEASGEVAGADRRADDASDERECLVAALVAVAVVDRLEVVEVEQDRRERADACGRRALPSD